MVRWSTDWKWPSAHWPFGLAFSLWRSRHSGGVVSRARRSYWRTSAFALGAGIMAVELPTAFMYFGAVSTILAARVAAPAELSLVITYNVLFAAPLFALLLVRRTARADAWIASAESAVRRLGQPVLAVLTAGAGTVLLALGLSGLALG